MDMNKIDYEFFLRNCFSLSQKKELSGYYDERPPNINFDSINKHILLMYV